MPGVPRELAEHHLHVRPEAKPVKQPPRFAEERRKAIGEEIARLLAAGFIMEVHPDWLANPVLVLKKNGSWRMCIDYTSLNKACPKDPFPLPRIDQPANSGLPRLSRGIEANPEKIGAIEKMELPQCLKDVQFTGCLASLSRFVTGWGEGTAHVPAAEEIGQIRLVTAGG
ncbi:hypothetical protein QYE76_023117 [Lolium multiflorum]|uniref:Uncharacterized protein n=1 Tax=Lolium multiflorum TaxID=4521 RepID=A0AAD8VUF5_LOLMU|nr:hypothetical protein QYE76_023117 [Lolium multiflorum]